MSSSSLPVWTIILDVFGTLLVGGGIFFLVTEGEVLGMPAADLQGAAIGMIVVGVMLMVPLIVAVVRKAAGQSQ